MFNNASASGIGLHIEATGNHGIRISPAGGSGVRAVETLADDVSIAPADRRACRLLQPPTTALT
jgi:hypothetical protein